MQIGNSLGGSNYFQNRNQIKLKQTANQQNTAKTTSSNNKKTVDENKLDGDFEKFNTVDSKLSKKAKEGLRIVLNIISGFITPFGFPGFGDAIIGSDERDYYDNLFLTPGSKPMGNLKTVDDLPAYTQKYENKPKKDFLA